MHVRVKRVGASLRCAPSFVLRAACGAKIVILMGEKALRAALSKRSAVFSRYRCLICIRSEIAW